MAEDPVSMGTLYGAKEGRCILQMSDLLPPTTKKDGV
jgi:hypothetical protein